jgi:hypothetical protein
LEAQRLSGFSVFRFFGFSVFRLFGFSESAFDQNALLLDAENNQTAIWLSNDLRGQLNDQEVLS